MLFLPQQPEPGMETPGIQHFGRIVVLLVPLNSVMNLGQITSVLQLIKVILQNTSQYLFVKPAGLSTSLAMALVEELQTGLVLRLCDELVDWMQPSSVRSLVWCQSCLWARWFVDQYLRGLSGLYRLSVFQSTIASKKWGNVKPEHFSVFLKFLLTKSEAGAIITLRHQKSRDFLTSRGACGDCEQAVVNLEMGWCVYDDEFGNNKNSVSTPYRAPCC